MTSVLRVKCSELLARSIPPGGQEAQRHHGLEGEGGRGLPVSRPKGTSTRGAPPLRLDHRIVVKGKWVKRLKGCVKGSQKTEPTGCVCLLLLATEFCV